MYCSKNTRKSIIEASLSVVLMIKNNSGNVVQILRTMWSVLKVDRTVGWHNRSLDFVYVPTDYWRRS